MTNQDKLHAGLSWFVPSEGDQHPGFKACVVSTFDGVHKHHRRLLQYALEITGNTPAEILVLVVTSGSDSKDVLLTLPERLSLISNLVSTHFTFSRLEFSDINPGPSVQHKKQLIHFFDKVRLLIPGSDLLSHCGQPATIEPLLECASLRNVPVDMHFALSHPRDLSGDVHHYLVKGDVQKANQLLGYSYALGGVVVKGNKIGRTLGYPTANLKPLGSNKVVPAQGVYAAMVFLEGQWHQSMVNIGIRPTLDLHNVTIEANLFDFHQDIYGKEISIHFLERLRDEMRFSSLADLKHQLHADQQTTLQVLKENIHKLIPRDGILVIRDKD